jgi:hypothetical protein
MINPEYITHLELTKYNGTIAATKIHFWVVEASLWTSARQGSPKYCVRNQLPMFV